jgi:CRP/FNR family transcriptional regulator, dissimilatory nitrate respiration regulator
MDGADQRVALQALLFRNLPENLALGLIEPAVVKNFARGEAIFLQGDPADFIGVVLDGWVKLFRVKPNGAEAVIGVFTRGNSFGEAPAVMEAVFPFRPQP